MPKTSKIHSLVNTRIITSIFVMTTCCICFNPEFSYAVTEGANNLKQVSALTDVYNSLKGIITGAGGKIIALASLLLGLAAAAATSSIKVLFPTGGIALAVGAGPSVIENVVGAIF